MSFQLRHLEVTSKRVVQYRTCESDCEFIFKYVLALGKTTSLSCTGMALSQVTWAPVGMPAIKQFSCSAACLASVSLRRWGCGRQNKCAAEPCDCMRRAWRRDDHSVWMRMGDDHTKASLGKYVENTESLKMNRFKSEISRQSAEMRIAVKVDSDQAVQVIASYA
eukprot:3882015-Amphidinium_carterae.1